MVSRSPRETGPVSWNPFSIMRSISGSSASGGAPPPRRRDARCPLEGDEVAGANTAAAW